MRSFFQFLLIALTILALCHSDFQAQIDSPYAADDSTIILMHFNGDLNFSGNYSGNISNWGAGAEYISSLVGFDRGFRINNSDQLQCLLMDVPPDFELGSDWTVEFWIKVGTFGSGSAEYPSIFIKDGFGMTAINIGFRKDGSGFTGAVTFSNQTELRIEQSNGINTGLWHHVAFISNSETRTISLIVHDEDGFIVFNESLGFPSGSDGILCEAERQMFLGGVDGSSNIQFDGWIDEFRISNTSRDFSPVMPELPPLQFRTKNLELYSESEDASLFSLIQENLQAECIELSSFWDRPMNDSILASNSVIKIYLMNRDEFQQYAGTRMSEWKCSWFDNETSTIILTDPISQDQTEYYGSFEALAKGAIAQLMVYRKLKLRENRNAPEFVLEGFGLYRGGYRPDRSKILEAIDDLGRYPARDDIATIDNFNESYYKDLITAYIECQLFNGSAYLQIDSWMQSAAWDPYFKYYYEPEDNDRIMLRYQSENFDFYCAAQDIPYLERIKNKIEEKLAHYEDCYQKNIHNRFNVIIYPTAQAGIECMNYDDYNGGSGCGGDKLDILSPVHFSGGIDEALLSLIPHEFFHVFHNHLSPSMSLIYGFHAEGMAELMAYENNHDSYLAGYKTYIRNGLERFVNENGREPKLADIMPDSDLYMSVYTYGQAFWYFMLKNHADYVTIKKFFESGNDWTVFDVSYEEIDEGYIDYLKHLAGFFPSIISGPIPADGTGNLPITTKLRWGISNTESLDLLLDTVNPPVTKALDGAATANIFSYSPDSLEYSTTYYWQIILHNEYGDAESDVWSFTTKPMGEITLQSPNGGEVFIENTLNILEWSCLNVDEMRIEFSSDNGSSWIIQAESIDASLGSYNWLIPEAISNDCLIRVSDKDDPDINDISDGNFIIESATGIDDILSGIPSKFVLMQNYPNPFNPSTEIVYGLPEQSHVSLKVFDLTGQEIIELVNEVKPAGYYTRRYDSSELSTSVSVSGIYFYVLKAGRYNSVKKMILLK